MTSLSAQYTALKSIHSIRVFTTVGTYDVDKAARSMQDNANHELAKSTLLKSLPKMCLRTIPHVAAAASLYNVSRLASVDCGATHQQLTNSSKVQALHSCHTSTIRLEPLQLHWYNEARTQQNTQMTAKSV
eukprot:4448-Heterococcus_DN1.PRE.2